MTTIEAAVPEEVAYLIPIGDIHIGDKSFGAQGRSKLVGYLNWVKDHPNARIFLMGDVLNCATRSIKTSPFESVQGEYDEAFHIFAPFAGQILGAI